MATDLGPMETMPVTDADAYPMVDYTKCIVLECSDGKACVLPKQLARLSKVLENLVIKAEREQDNSKVNVPLPEITSSTIGKIYEYLRHHAADWPPTLKVEKPLRRDLKESLDTWDYNYYATHLLENGDPCKSDSIFLVLKAAMFLECEPVRDFACASLANVVGDIKGEEDFYHRFGVTDKFTKEEKDKLYDDYEYRDSKKDEKK